MTRPSPHPLSARELVLDTRGLLDNHRDTTLLLAWWLAVAVMIVLSSCAPKPSTPISIDDDPLTIIRLLNDRFTDKQIGAANNLFADNVRFTDSTGEIHWGKPFVLGWLENARQRVDASELAEISISSDKIVWTLRLNQGRTITQGTNEAVIEQGKIVVLKTSGW